MNIYLDASVGISALHRDDLHERAAAAIARMDDVPVLSSWLVAEFTTAVTILFRRSAIDEAGAEGVYRHFRALSATAIMAEVLNDDVLVAAQIVKQMIGGMWAPDALHLAICKRLDAPLLTFDQRMAGGARSIGLTVFE